VNPANPCSYAVSVANQDRLFPIPVKRSRGRYRRGFDDTLRALRDLGRLEPVDAARVALARGLADELDAATADRDESRYTRGTLAARYDSVLSHLLTPGSVSDAGDLDALYAALDNAAD
jgi:hypothetical protein